MEPAAILILFSPSPPNQIAAYSNRGAARYLKGDLDGAIIGYRTAIVIDPQSAETYANRRLVLLIQGKPSEAERDFKQSLKLELGLKAILEARISKVKPRD